jgi:crossover junction endodeoxyribonuclease RuvC
MNMLKIKDMPKYLDATDGLAVAVCHAIQNKNLTTQTKENWSQFVKKNPRRIN